MLKSTFQHLRGIGKKSERILWQKGILSWDEYSTSFSRQLSLFGGASLCESLQKSIQSYDSGNMEYFSKVLCPAEYYRIALEFPQDVLFLDIETTGLSLYYDIISIVGWSVGKNYGVYINGQDDFQLRTALNYAKVIVTFNGTLFDLKFLKKHFEDLAIPPVHLDLRFFAKRVCLSGGQKIIEKMIGFKRESDVEDMLGEAAPILWHKYRRGGKGAKEAMKRLIEYNHADIEGMKWILDACIKAYFEKEAIPQKIRKNPNFANQTSPLEWATRKSKSLKPYKIYVPKFTGSSKPLITYDQLNDIHNLDDFCTIGIDLVSSEKRETGFCVLRGREATTCRVKTDEEMINLAIEAGADLISIDSPLSIPKGRTSFFDDDPMRDKYGITRECERILKKRGISSYPCLIPSMQKLTQRGMLLAQKFRKLGIPVIESYPGAAQDIMAIPRKQAGLGYLVEGLIEFGLTGDFVDKAVTHDELDAITSAVVGHFFWVKMYEGLGNPEEEYLIIPDLNADYKNRLSRKIFGVSGPIAAGKTTVADYFVNKGYTYARYSQVLNDMLRKKGVEPSRSALQELGWKIHREKGQRWLGKKLIQLTKGKKRIVIDGLRFLEDHALMVETYGPSFIHLYIDTPFSERKKRVKKDRSEDISLEVATSNLVELETQQLKKIAHKVIVNRGTIKSMFKKIDQIKI